MGDKVLDLLSRRFAQSLRATEVRGVGLHQVGIKLMLADDLAEPVAHFGATVVSVGRLPRELAHLRCRLFGYSTDLLKRADTNTVSFA